MFWMYSAYLLTLLAGVAVRGTVEMGPHRNASVWMFIDNLPALLLAQIFLIFVWYFSQRDQVRAALKNRRLTRSIAFAVGVAGGVATVALLYGIWLVLPSLDFPSPTRSLIVILECVGPMFTLLTT